KFARRHKAVLLSAAAVALGVLLALVGLAVSNVRIRQEQARTREEKDRAEQAQQVALERAEQIRQGLERLKAANALVEKARVFSNWQRWDDAHAALTRALELRPDHAPAWEARGDLYIRLNLWELAAADFGRAFELQEPALAWRWMCLAQLRTDVGDVNG